VYLVTVTAAPPVLGCFGDGVAGREAGAGCLDPPEPDGPQATAASHTARSALHRMKIREGG